MYGRGRENKIKTEITRQREKAQEKMKATKPDKRKTKELGKAALMNKSWTTAVKACV
jgi:hypothetical protein